MTVSAVATKVIFTGAGTTGPFAFKFPVFETSHIVVTKQEIATGTETVLTETTDYTVALDPVVGGTVTLVTAITSSYKLIIQRIVPLTQETNYVENDPFPAESHEEALDKLTMITQQLKEEIDRTVQMPATVSDPIEMPVPEAGKYLRGVSATEVAWQELVITETEYPAAFSTGLDADLPTSPSLGDIYFASDTGKLYVCKVGGSWTHYIVDINSYTGKTTLTGNDIFLIEDSAASNAKKKVTFTNLLASITNLTKVKASSGDATPDYLDGKVDGTSIVVTADKLSVKASVLNTITSRMVKAVPEPSISLGAASACMENGDLRVWGNNVKLGCGTSHPHGVDRVLPAIAALPDGAGSIVKVYHAHSNIFCIDDAGQVYGAGWNVEGELADGTANPSYVFKRIGTLTDVDHLVIPGGTPTAAIPIYAITTDNKLYVWGCNTSGQLGVGSILNVTTPTLVGTDFADVACNGLATGYTHAIALKTDGKVYGTGRNAAGQLGLNDTSDRSAWTEITALTGVKIEKIYCTGESATGSSFFVDDAGAVYACGDNSLGQLCTGDTTDLDEPTVIASVTGVSSLAVSKDEYGSVCAVKSDGSVRTWGYNSYGQLGDTSTTNRTTAYDPSLTNITKAVFAGTGSYSTLWCLDSTGIIKGAGYNVNGNIGNGDNVSKTSFVSVLGCPAAVVSDISSNGYAQYGKLAILTTDSRMFLTGYNGTGELGIGNLTATNTMHPVVF